jgi:hypothetical protein
VQSIARRVNHNNTTTTLNNIMETIQEGEDPTSSGAFTPQRKGATATMIEQQQQQGTDFGMQHHDQDDQLVRDRQHFTFDHVEFHEEETSKKMKHHSNNNHGTMIGMDIIITSKNSKKRITKEKDSCQNLLIHTCLLIIAVAMLVL